MEAKKLWLWYEWPQQEPVDSTRIKARNEITAWDIRSNPYRVEMNSMSGILDPLLRVETGDRETFDACCCCCT